MANQTTIFKKLEILEKEFQKLKIETFLALPKRAQKFVYSEKSLKKAIQDLRKAIWQERYAKKI